MKIAHIVCRYPPYYSGMGTVVFETAAELVKRDHTMTVYTPEYYEEKEIQASDAPEVAEPAPELQKNLDFAKRIEPSITYGNAARLSGLDKELGQYDLVHLHYPFFGTAGLVRRWKKKNPTVPLVVTYHMDTRATGWLGLIFKVYSRYFLPKILNSADVIIGSSFDYIRASDAGYHLQQFPNKWVELPFGVNIERFTPGSKNKELLVQSGLSPEMPTIIFVGGMDQAHFFKGVVDLLEAIFVAKNLGTTIQAILVGDGDKRAEYELKAQGLGITDQISFVGRIENDQLPEYYRAADLLVLPSTTVGEAFGMVLLEAYASGVPVVASDLPGVRTVAARAGTVVKPHDPSALAQVLIDYFGPEVDRAAWQQTARAVAEAEFAWPHIVDRLEFIYNSLVKK